MPSVSISSSPLTGMVKGLLETVGVYCQGGEACVRGGVISSELARDRTFLG